MIMKNTNVSTSTRRNMKQNAPQSAPRNTTYCITQSTFQRKILNLIQQAGNKIAEAMNIIDEVGATTGINIHFERSKLTECDEQEYYRCKASRHSDGTWSNRTNALDEAINLTNPMSL